MKNKENWMLKPSKTVAIIFGIGWLLCIILTIIGTTNFFSESLFETKNTVVFLLVLGGTGVTFKIIRNYYRCRKENKKGMQ